jgi:hypothetical protein
MSSHEKTELLFLACNIKQNTDMNNICLEKSFLTIDNKHELTKSITERFLTTLNIPTCKCSTEKLHAMNTNVKYSSMNDNITCISLDDNSSITSSPLSLDKKKIKQTSIKCMIIFIEDLISEFIQLSHEL